VKFPDEDVRRDIVLTFPFSGKRIPADCPQSVADETEGPELIDVVALT